MGSSGYYLRTIWAGKSKPSRSSYWIWFFLGLLIFPSYILSGGKNWPLNAINTFFCGWIAHSSLRYGEGGALTKWDRRAVVIAVLSVPAWVVLALFLPGETATRPIFAVQMIADAFATFVVYEKAWNRPWNEDKTAWAISIVAFAANAMAAPGWEFEDVVLNGWMGGTAVAITIILHVRPRYFVAEAPVVMAALET